MPIKASRFRDDERRTYLSIAGAIVGLGLGATLQAIYLHLTTPAGLPRLMILALAAGLLFALSGCVWDEAAE
jgi:F0F1-type ATP synthase assembly protein I